MTNTTDRYLIKKFLRNELTSEEKVAFTNRKEDATFLEALENEMIAVQSRQELKKKLQGIGADHKVQKTNTPKRFAPLGIAASVILLLGTFFFFNQGVNNQELFEEHYTSYPNIYTQKGTSDNDKTLFEKTMILYDAKQYPLAKQNFETLNSERELTDGEQFYYGITLLELDDTKTALTQFKNINNTASPLYKDAQWYLALCYVQENNVDQAKLVLTELQEIVGKKKQEEIKTILNQL